MTKNELLNVNGGISFTGLFTNYVTKCVYIVYSISKIALKIINK